MVFLYGNSAMGGHAIESVRFTHIEYAEEIIMKNEYD